MLSSFVSVLYYTVNTFYEHPTLNWYKVKNLKRSIFVFAATVEKKH